MSSNNTDHKHEDIVKRSEKIKDAFSPKRTMARIALVLLVGCIIATLVCALTTRNAMLTLALLFCDMAIPIFFYLLQWVAKLVRDDPQDDE